MRSELYEFQKRGAEFAYEHRYSLNTCQMGLGKTAMALALVERVKGKTLVFCPAFLRTNWVREIEKHLGPAWVGSFVIVPYSTLSSKQSSFHALKSTRFETVIADEFHYIKTPGSLRSKRFSEIMAALKPPYFVGLTGTPIKNRIPELYNLIRIVSMNPKPTSGLDVSRYFPTLDSFCKRYCYEKVARFGGASYVEYHGLRANRVEELKQLLAGKVFKVSAEEQIKLPPIRHQKVFTSIEEPADFSQEYDNFILGGRSVIAKKASAILKVPFTEQYVADLVEQGLGPIIVFTDHVDPANNIANRFKVKPITGATPADERIGIGGEGNVVVATIGAFSVGVNLTRACHLVFNDISWVPADNEQALKRIHRIGQDKPCTIHYVVGGHVDEFILDTVQKKMTIINKVTS